MMAWLIEGWPLFGASYVVAWALAVALPLAGIPIVAREQALLGAGLVQLGACAVAVALAVGLPWPGVWACAVIVAGSWLGARPPQRERPEAIAAWMILAGGALTVLALSRQPQAAEMMARLQASSVLGAGWGEAAVASALAVGVVVIAAWRGRAMLFVAWDPAAARLQGVAGPGQTVAVALVTALVLSVALKLTGALFTTAVLVLPVLVARRLVRRLRWLPVAAVGIALAAVTCGAALSWSWDLPPAQVAVALLGAAVACSWCRRGLG